MINHIEGGSVLCKLCNHPAISHINYKPIDKPKLARVCKVKGCICTNFWGKLFDL